MLYFNLGMPKSTFVSLKKKQKKNIGHARCMVQWGYTYSLNEPWVCFGHNVQWTNQSLNSNFLWKPVALTPWRIYNLHGGICKSKDWTHLRRGNRSARAWGKSLHNNNILQFIYFIFNIWHVCMLLHVPVCVIRRMCMPCAFCTHGA